MASDEASSPRRLPLRQYWNLLSDYIRPQRGRFVLLTLLLFASIGLQVINPQIVRTFIDAATATKARPLLYAALAFVAVALVQQLVSIGATYVGENVAWTATNALRGALLRHCMRLGLGFHQEHPPGELIERIDGDVAQLSAFFSQLVIRVVGNLLLLAGILAALFLEDWRLGLAFSVFAAVALVALNRVRDIAVPHQKARRQASADLFSFLEEQLSGTEDIRSSGAMGFVMRGAFRLHHAMLQTDWKASRANFVINVVADVVALVGHAMAVLAGYSLHRAGLVTVGTVYLIVHYINLLLGPIHELTRQTESFQTIGASVARLDELRQVSPALVDGPGAPLPAGPLPLAFDYVAFAYVEEEPVLHGVNFALTPGRVLGLLGRTGSGKTTLARLVFRLYDATAGRVLLGGVDVREPRLRDLRQRVAFVTQDVQLFQATVRDNLTFFDRAIPDARIRAAIEQLELADWYAALPQGLDTELESGGRGLSAGEAQLLAFTRVFLRDPGLVILDEASSRLDPATEQRIERAVDRLLHRRTAIIIAHRLGTVQRADEIMILDQGRVLEHGSRAALARDPASRFYRLLQTGLEDVLV